MNGTINPATAAAIRCVIRIKGTVGESVLGAFPAFQPEFREGETVLIGQLADQAALHGMLARVEGLGLELVALETNS